jgi:hypothetical protein
MLKSMVVGVKVDHASKDAPAKPQGHKAMSAALRFILDPKSLTWQRD